MINKELNKRISSVYRDMEARMIRLKKTNNPEFAEKIIQQLEQKMTEFRFDERGMVNFVMVRDARTLQIEDERLAIEERLLEKHLENEPMKFFNLVKAHNGWKKVRDNKIGVIAKLKERIQLLKEKFEVKENAVHEEAKAIADRYSDLFASIRNAIQFVQAKFDLFVADDNSISKPLPSAQKKKEPSPSLKM